MSDGQVITEDENGKSYFNLGSADATIVARKTSGAQNPLWMNGNCTNSSSLDMDDNASSSSCESLSSSEDLFNSGEEFDGSDDEEEEFSSYKQQRSTVLHLSLCKLNKFRSVRFIQICNNSDFWHFDTSSNLIIMTFCFFKYSNIAWNQVCTVLC